MKYVLVLVTPPASMAVSEFQVIEHLRLGDWPPEDMLLLETYIETAVQGQNMFGVAPMVALATIFGAFAGAIAGAIVSRIVEGFSRKRR